jgi:hypothetical protein
MSYAESFDQALDGLFSKQAPALAATAPGSLSAAALGRQINQAFEAYLNALGEQRFADSAQQLERLRNLIRQLAGRGGMPDDNNHP